MTHGGGGQKAHIVVTYRMKIEDALEKATLASLPIMTPSGSLDLMMRWIAAEGKDISSGTGLTCSISLASPFFSSTAAMALRALRATSGLNSFPQFLPSIPSLSLNLFASAGRHAMPSGLHALAPRRAQRVEGARNQITI